jgi:hypothetical protein
VRNAARRVVEREANRALSNRAVRIIKKEARRARAAGNVIVTHGRQKIMAGFDSSNPGSQSDAQSVLQEIATALGCDADDPNALQTAFASLLEAAGVSKPQQSANERPKQIDANAVRRGRAMMSWPPKRG